MPSGANAQPTSLEPRELPKDAAAAVLNRLPTWAASWSQLLRGFSPRKCVSVDRQEVAVPSSGDATLEPTWMPYDLEFARRYKSLFRPAPDGSFWADIYVATFQIDDSEKLLQANVGDTSYLNLLDPRTGHAWVVWVLGIGCGFDDAFWLGRGRLVAVGSCLEDEKQRPFVAHLDLQSHVLERFDYPVASSTRFDTERYIRHKNPRLRF